MMTKMMFSVRRRWEAALTVLRSRTLAAATQRLRHVRRIADEAEGTARKYQNQPESMKKKGLFGKKKPIEKDPVRAANGFDLAGGVELLSNHFFPPRDLTERGGTPCS